MNTRDLGLNHSPGKGDKPRTKFDANWLRRISKIKFPKLTDAEKGFRRVDAATIRKNYG